MIKTNEVTRSQLRGMSGIYLDKYVLRTGDVVIANKVVKTRKFDKLESMSIYKDLFLRTLDEDMYVSLTDVNKFQRNIKGLQPTILEDLTNGTSLEYFDKEDARLGLANIEKLYSYGLHGGYLDYKAAIKLLKRMNKFIDAKVKANIIQQYGEDMLVDDKGILRFNIENLGEMNDLVNTVPGTEMTLSKKFEK